VEEIVITRLADLRIGDRIISREGRTYNPPYVVTAIIGAIEAGSPGEGVRLASPVDSWLGHVLNRSQVDGRVLEVQRY